MSGTSGDAMSTEFEAEGRTLRVEVESLGPAGVKLRIVDVETNEDVTSPDEFPQSAVNRFGSLLIDAVKSSYLGTINDAKIREDRQAGVKARAEKRAARKAGQAS